MGMWHNTTERRADYRLALIPRRDIQGIYKSFKIEIEKDIRRLLKAKETRKINEERRKEAAIKAAEALEKTVTGLNKILEYPEATNAERIRAAKLIVELKKDR